MPSRDIVMSAAGVGGGGGSATYVEDVFSTYLYTGNGVSQTINNGINLGTAYGGSVNFDGTGDYLSVPSNSAFNFGTGDFTVEFCINRSSVTSYPTIVDINYGTAPNLLIQGDTTGLYAYVNGTSVGLGNLSLYPDSVGTWYHYALVRNGTTITWYRNGTSIGSATYSGNVGNSSVATYIGGSLGGGGYYLNGYLSNVRIVKGTAVYTSNFTPPTEPLTAISGTSLLTCQNPNPVLDYSSNNFTITVNGNATATTGGGPFTSSTPGDGGMVWVKVRNNTWSHNLVDTVRGNDKILFSNRTDAQYTNNPAAFTSFNSNGFSLQDEAALAANSSGYNYASWTFRKAPKFFDVVTYTGTGSEQAISHSLGSTPGMIIIKSTSTTQDWPVYHDALADNYLLYLNTTGAQDSSGIRFGTPTDTTFTVKTAADINASGVTYVAYLFASDAGGFGASGTDSIISCGSFTTDGSGNASVTLGWEPQYFMFKSSSSTDSWYVVDNMRGMVVGTGDAHLSPNSSAAEVVETSQTWFTPTATGFQAAFAANTTFIYMAIRRGPMKTPTDPTTVFSVTAPTLGSPTTTTTTNFVADGVFYAGRSGFFTRLVARLMGNNFMSTNTTDAESATSQYWDSNTTFGFASGALGGSTVKAFQRAPGFFDVVCYTGTGTSGQTFNHNLGVAPELMIVKRRNSGGSWFVYNQTTGATKVLFIDLTDSATTFSAAWNNTAPTSSVFTVGNDTSVNASGSNYIAHLFASCPGVSKVGSYTGTGATQTIACGFTGGARFVLIKRTDSTGDWYVWDTARGMVSGTDPSLLLNSAAAEVNANSVYTTTGGFQIVSTAAGINASGGSYIYLAVA